MFEPLKIWWDEFVIYRSLFLGLLFISLAACATSGSSRVSTGMQEIVGKLRVNESTLDTSGLYKGDPEEFEFIKRQSHAEVYRLPNNRGIADAFQYTVYYFKADKQYWVTEVGGVAGVSNLYGPAEFPPGK